MNLPVVEMMPASFPLWRCLHGGPLSRESIDRWAPDSQMLWTEYRERNLPFLQKLTEIYGACAVVARLEGQVVGHLRFYPKEIFFLNGTGNLCMQQEYPYGPARDLVKKAFPPLHQLMDRTLVVHCMMTGSPSQKENPYQRKGLASQMVRKLVDWASENGWQAIEATAYEDLPLIYEVTGQAGKSFWEKLGFCVAGTGIEPELTKEYDFTHLLREQATARGLPQERIKNKYTMHLDLPDKGCLSTNTESR
jgi:RimJ/RimL family protein N-acetyltransferase